MHTGLAEKYLARTRMLLRLLDDGDLGHYVHPIARQAIERVLHEAPAELGVIYLKPKLASEVAAEAAAEIE